MGVEILYKVYKGFKPVCCGTQYSFDDSLICCFILVMVVVDFEHVTGSLGMRRESTLDGILINHRASYVHTLILI